MLSRVAFRLALIRPPRPGLPRLSRAGRGALPAAALILLAWTGLASGCGAFQIRDLSGYPPSTRTLYLHNFTNESFQPDVNVELNEWVRGELARRGNFFLRDERDQARLWLYGEITVYRREGRMYDNLRTPVRSELVIACRIRLRQNPARRDSGPQTATLLTRELAESVHFSQDEGLRETEFDARQRLLRRLSAEIANTIEAEYAGAFAALAAPEQTAE